jgi:hypothetical protein
MSRLSDFQQQSVVVDPKKMGANAKAAGSQMDWRATKIKTNVRGGRMDVEPFREASRQIARNIAFDAVHTARRIAAHIALEEALDEAADGEPKDEDEDAEPVEESTTQRPHGGGCGKSFTCDSGQLITGRKSTDEIRRLGLNYAVF